MVEFVTIRQSLLDSHPQVVCHNEIFHQSETSLFLKKSNNNACLFDTAWRNQHPDLFIDLMIDETRKQYRRIKLVGCKLLLNEIQLHNIDVLLKLRPRIIVLTRNNRLAWYSSFKIATETQVWLTHDYPTSQHKIIFDEKEFCEWLEAQSQLEQYALNRLQENNINFVTFDYDDLTDECTTTKILNFLGLPEVNLLADTIPQNSTHILDRFSNPEEVIAFSKSIHQLAWINPQEQVNKQIKKRKITALERQWIKARKSKSQRMMKLLRLLVTSWRDKWSTLIRIR